MVGYPLKILLKMIENRHGPEAVREILKEAGLPADRTYRLNVSYPDHEARVVTEAAGRLLPMADIAEAFFQDTLQRFPKWYEMCKTSREFLEMQPQIHNTFAHGLHEPKEREAIREKFRLEKLEDELVVHYRSGNLMCDMYKAIAQHVFQHYREEATLMEPRCMKRGDEECELRIRWIAETWKTD